MHLASKPIRILLAAVTAIIITGAAARAQLPGRQSTLYLVTIGVSEFAQPIHKFKIDGVEKVIDSRNGVRFAAKDAEDIAATLQAQEGRLYGRVIRKTVTNGQATRLGIQQALAWLKTQPIQADDVVIVFAAGHGATTGFVPYDDDLSPNGLVAWTTIQG